MVGNSGINRRELLVKSAICGTAIAIAGCSSDDGGSDGGDIQDSDGDGVIDSEDYAPNDPEVQEKSDVQSNDSTETSTKTPTPEPRESLGVPSCTGDSIIKIVEISPVIEDSWSRVTIAFENIGNEAVYDMLLSVGNTREIESNNVPLNGVLEAGTRVQLEGIEVPSLPEGPNQISVGISGNKGGAYGPTLGNEPCVER
jgi:hypothetical protein